MSEFGIYDGTTLFASTQQEPTPIVENFLYEKDNIFLVAEEKSGKSLFCLQLAFCLTTAEPFLDQFEIPIPKNVLYVQTEGKRFETISRMRAMRKAIPCDESRFWLYFAQGLELNTTQGVSDFISYIQSIPNPDVIIFDPLYTTVSGDLSAQEVASNTGRGYRRIIDKFNCETITSHHIHRQRRTDKGVAIDEGDDVIFGSKIWKAFIDHMFVLRMNKKHKTLQLTCDTQRTGNIVPELELALRQPDPLYFEAIQLDGTMPIKATWDVIKGLTDPIGAKEIAQQASIPKKSVYYALKELAKLGQVSLLPDKYPHLYKRS